MTKKKIRVLIEKIYVFLPNYLKIKILILLKERNLDRDYLKSRFDYKGKFDIQVDKAKKFSMVKYGGMIEDFTFWDGLFKTWEQDNGWLWIELSKVSNTIFDIGANTGIYSLVSKAVNPKSDIYAFEPSPRNFEKLEKNIKLNRFNIKAERLAVSNTNGEENFYDMPNPNQTTSGLKPDVIKGRADYKSDKDLICYKVETLTLDHYIKINNIKNIDLMKIDVELNEPEVLQGFQNHIINFEPIIVVEVLNNEIAKKLNELIDFSVYNIYHLKKDLTVDRKMEIEISDESYDKWEWNFVCIPKSKNDLIRCNTSLFKRLN